MSLQKQFRRDSNTNLMAAVPAAGEPGWDTTNARAVVGDGVKPGGHPIAMWLDIQGQKFTNAAVGGTANAITLTFAPQLLPAALATHQRFAFIASSTNTSTVTLQLTDGTTSRTAKAVKKIEASAKVALVAGDITANLPYDVYYDGTDYVLMGSGGGLADGSVTNAKLADAAAGDYISAVAFADESNAFPGTTYAKMAEIKAPRAGTYRVRVRVREATNRIIYGKAYVNGTTAGTEIFTASQNFSYQNDDIVVSAGDLVQLYLRSNLSDGTWLDIAGGESDTENFLVAIALCELDPINGGALYTTARGWF